MKILLLGEYSNVHATLAEGLRELGHETIVASNGDFWKDYPRDIDLTRKPGRWGGMRLMARLAANASRLKNYDVVQLINPLFLELKAEKMFKIYHRLRRNNRRMFMGAFGMDYYWVHENMTRKPLRYSDFNIGETIRHTPDALKERQDWIGTAKETLNQTIANDCDGIIAGLYEYWACYHPLFTDKTTFIPYPIKPKPEVTIGDEMPRRPVRIFVGISKGRSAYKGTDIMLAAAKAVRDRYPRHAELKIAEGVPFDEYVGMMDDSDCILDQLYSYTPSMNALEAMSRGIICVGGGEPENYEILGERELRPIVNVQPHYESVYQELENLVLNPSRIPLLKRQSVEYIRRHHDYKWVATQYVSYYSAHGENR